MRETKRIYTVVHATMSFHVDIPVDHPLLTGKTFEELGKEYSQQIEDLLLDEVDDEGMHNLEVQVSAYVGEEPYK